MRSQRIVIGIAVLGLAVLPGCYASTEPATDVGIDSATLNARGTANNGPAESWFEYELNGRVGEPRDTLRLSWPAGASGPFTAKVNGLAAGTQYWYRVCGRDSAGEPACANARTFTTKPPVKDAVFGGYWFGCCGGWSVNATSGPSGENPTGTISWHNRNQFDSGSTGFSGIVTCLKVDGPRATVVAVGNMRNTHTGTETPITSTAIVVDGRTAGDSTFEHDVTGTAPLDCDDVTGTPQGPLDAQHELIVNDAQP